MDDSCIVNETDIEENEIMKQESNIAHKEQIPMYICKTYKITRKKYELWQLKLHAFITISKYDDKDDITPFEESLNGSKKLKKICLRKGSRICPENELLNTISKKALNIRNLLVEQKAIIYKKKTGCDHVIKNFNIICSTNNMYKYLAEVVIGQSSKDLMWDRALPPLTVIFIIDRTEKKLKIESWMTNEQIQKLFKKSFNLPSYMRIIGCKHIDSNTSLNFGNGLTLIKILETFSERQYLNKISKFILILYDKRSTSEWINDGINEICKWFNLNGKITFK